MLTQCSAMGQACLFSLKFCCLLFAEQISIAMCILEFSWESQGLICSFHYLCNPTLSKPWDTKENTQLWSNLTIFSLNYKKKKKFRQALYDKCSYILAQSEARHVDLRDIPIWIFFASIIIII